MAQFIDVSQGVKKEKQKTIFTHYQHEESGWSNALAGPEDFQKIFYLGFCKKAKADIFAAICRNETISIYKGIKGDEFNQQILIQQT